MRQAWIRTKNSSVPEPDGVSYRLIKAVKDTVLGEELINEGAIQLLEGNILDKWKAMRVVLIPKPGRNLTIIKNRRPINLINYIGTLGKRG